MTEVDVDALMDGIASATRKYVEEQVPMLIAGEVSRQVAALPPPRDGRDGAPGRDGRDGADKDTTSLEPDFEALASRAASLVKAGKDGLNGKDGKDADPVDVEAVARRVAELLPRAKDGAPGASVRIGYGAPTFDARAGDVYVDLKSGAIYECR